MRWRTLQTGNIYVRQNTYDAQLTVEELRDMVVVRVKLSRIKCFVLLLH